MTPAALLLGQYLAHCPTLCRRDAALASMAAAFALDLAAPGAPTHPPARLPLPCRAAQRSTCLGQHGACRLTRKIQSRFAEGCALACARPPAGGRLVPEAISMLSALLHTAGGDSRKSALKGVSANLAHQLGEPWLWAPAAAEAQADAAAAAAAGKKKKAKGPKRPPLELLSVARVLELPAEDEYFNTEAFRLSLLHATVAVRPAASPASRP